MEKKLSISLILKERVQKLLDDFATVIHVHIVFFSREGAVLRQGREEDCTAFCRLMQQKYFSLEDCRKLDAAMEEKCAKSGKCECYTCHAGLCEAVMPVIAPGGLLLGFVMFGQFRSNENLPPCLLRKVQGKKERKILEEAYHSLPCYSGDEVKKMSGLLELLVDYIVRCELVTLGGDSFYARLCDYIDANFRKKITVGTAAKVLGRSRSGLSHALHDGGYPSFVELLTERRLKYAEHLLATLPELTVAEAANLSGFQDPYYFSRVCRKYRGHSPGAFRRERKPQENG